MHSIAEKMRFSEPTRTKLNEERPILLAAKCRSMTLGSGDIRFVRIFAEVSCGEGVKRQWCCRQWQFSAFSLAISSETLEMRPSLIFSHTQSVVGFSAILKCMNDLEWLFLVKFCFRTGLACSNRATFYKTNKDRHTLSTAQIFGRDSSFWSYKV